VQVFDDNIQSPHIGVPYGFGHVEVFVYVLTPE
jgi:hypothetical protein